MSIGLVSASCTLDAVETAAVEEVAVAADRAITEIPIQFQGRWAAAADDCLEGYAESRLIVEPTRIEFFESAGTVTDVVEKGESELMLTAELSSEGTIFSRTMTFQLSDDGSSLTSTTQGTTNSLVRYRCSNS